MWHIVPDKPDKFRDPCLKCSREIPPKAVKGGIFYSFFFAKCHSELVSEVIASVTVESVGMDVRVKFGDFRSNGSQDIRQADSVSNERTNEHD